MKRGAARLFKFVANESIDGMFFRMRQGAIFRHGAVRPVLQSIVKLKGRFFASRLGLPRGLGSGAEFNPAADIGDGGFGSRPEGGIRKSGLWYSRASRSLEPEGSPGRTTAPASPPFSKPSGVDKTSPPRILSPPWHSRHWLTSMGRTVFSNSSKPGSAASSRRKESTATI